MFKGIYLGSRSFLAIYVCVLGRDFSGCSLGGGICLKKKKQHVAHLLQLYKRPVGLNRIRGRQGPGGSKGRGGPHLYMYDLTRFDAPRPSLPTTMYGVQRLARPRPGPGSSPRAQRPKPWIPSSAGPALQTPCLVKPSETACSSRPDGGGVI